ncbi:hypothetical protein G6O69_20950 [Pseudenhygromyxa sp. WMMC2535]|uniref:hypothetical protein n=1 Tax=Pseudenhygromyxa sp. WMMC2535 TaxID=2712867 RepID=UPI0015954256|nr:hypothetical protein [Pseudenhygromyxa sp. WMMC2535]NVB40322.1 hypothetical protein [Pseudenhygromyxa sp. WMMC2535]
MRRPTIRLAGEACAVPLLRVLHEYGLIDDMIERGPLRAGPRLSAEARSGPTSSATPGRTPAEAVALASEHRAGWAMALRRWRWGSHRH